MYWKIVRADVRESLLSTLFVTSFIMLASMLVALSVMMLVDLGAAADELLEKSKTPDFMQMHYGDLHKEEIQAFAQANDLVRECQIIEMTKIEGADIVLAGLSLVDKVQDNGVQAQSSSFDYLLGLDNEILYPEPGQVYLPLSYRDLAEPGDPARIGGQDLAVAGYLRDSQMNSNLSSSKRFLVHEDDYAAIRPQGKQEDIIEFILEDRDRVSNLEDLYSQAGLDANGPAVSYRFIKIINTLSDGLVIALLALIFFLLSS